MFAANNNQKVTLGSGVTPGAAPKASVSIRRVTPAVESLSWPYRLRLRNLDHSEKAGALGILAGLSAASI